MKAGKMVRIIQGVRNGEVATVVKTQENNLKCVIVKTQDGDLWVYRMRDLEILCN